MTLLPAHPKPTHKKKPEMKSVRGLLLLTILCAVTALGVLLSFPILLALSIEHQSVQPPTPLLDTFPVTVDPVHKLIVENEQVNAFLESSSSPLQAASGNMEHIAERLFTWIATAIGNAPWYTNLAAVNTRFVTVAPGMRKEQVAHAFATALDWSPKDERVFLTPVADATLPLPEGSFLEGTYLIPRGTTPAEAQVMVNDRFTTEILSHYGTTTASRVPLDQALTIASLIEREAGGGDDMRYISGIIWNRLFLNMHLQIDATLQYAKASSRGVGAWWPALGTGDQFRKSTYNTYLHRGLPPTPIASPSVAAVLAALNPKNTSCLYYFHDRHGGFHCSDTYQEHVALLKKYYGQGK